MVLPTSCLVSECLNEAERMVGVLVKGVGERMTMRMPREITTTTACGRKRTGGFNAFHGEKRTLIRLQFGRALILIDIDKSRRALCVPALNWLIVIP